MDMTASRYIGFSILTLLILLQIALLLRIGQRLEAVLGESMVELDHKLAEAIGSVVEKIPGLGEGGQEMNPFQQIIGELISSQIKQADPRPDIKLARAPSFSTSAGDHSPLSICS